MMMRGALGGWHERYTARAGAASVRRWRHDARRGGCGDGGCGRGVVVRLSPDDLESRRKWFCYSVLYGIYQVRYSW
jgi:hypothetical protein